MKPKSEQRNDWLKEVMENVVKRRGEYVRSRYYVVEVTPGYEYSYDNGHGQAAYGWQPACEKRVSEYFDTEEKAQYVVDTHDPDPGKILAIRKDDLYRRTVEEWH